jgi:hypothetical protein
MSEKQSSLRLWLARCKPDRVQCTLRNGEVRTLQKPTTVRGQWANLERGIVAVQPTFIEAYRGNECVASRALEDDDDELVDSDDPKQMFADAMAAATAAYIKTLPVITQLIVDAGDASAARHQDSYKLAFEAQLQLVKILSDRLGGLERAWHKMILDRAAEKGGVDDNDAAALSLIGNIMGAQKNGAAKPDGESQ